MSFYLELLMIKAKVFTETNNELPKNLIISSSMRANNDQKYYFTSIKFSM